MIGSRVNKFLDSEIVLYLVALLSAVIWITGYELIGILLWLIIGYYVCSYRNGLKVYLAIIAVVIFCISFEQFDSTFIYHSAFQSEGFNIFGIVLAVGVVGYIGAFVMHLIMFRPTAVVGTSNMLWPSIAVIAVAFLGGLNNADNSYLGNWMIAGFYFVLLLVVVVMRYVHCDFIKFGSTVGILAGLTVALETVAYFARQEDIWASILSKNIVVGWGLSNTMAPVMAIAMFCCAYKFTVDSKWRYLVGMTFFALCTLSTLCRSIIMQTCILFVVALVLMVVFSRKKYRACLYIVFVAGLLYLLYKTYTVEILAMLDDIFSRGVVDQPREDIRLTMIGYFQQYMWLGSGYGYINSSGSFAPQTPHSTILSLLGNGGIVATVVFGWYYFRKYQVMLRCKLTSYNAFAFLIVFMMIAYSCFDHAFLFIYQNIPLLIILEGVNRQSGSAKLWTLPAIKKVTSNKLVLVGGMVLGVVCAVFGSLIALDTLEGIYINDSYMSSYALYFSLFLVACISFYASLEQLIKDVFHKTSKVNVTLTNP